jgi:hypothetical protein
MSTCKAAADPRIIAIGTVSGTSTITSLHGPALFIRGGKDTVVSCDSVLNAYNTVKDQPAMFMNNLSADHDGWLYQNGCVSPGLHPHGSFHRQPATTAKHLRPQKAAAEEVLQAAAGAERPEFWRHPGYKKATPSVGFLARVGARRKPMLPGT